MPPASADALSTPSSEVPLDSMMEMRKKNTKRVAYSTEYSQAVTHPSTNSAHGSLTSVIRREQVCSTRCGRRHEMWKEWKTFTSFPFSWCLLYLQDEKWKEFKNVPFLGAYSIRKMESLVLCDMVENKGWVHGTLFKTLKVTSLCV